MSDRKYRQRGYRDEEHEAPSRPRGRAPDARPDGPRGRGLGAPGERMFRCRDCGTAVVDPTSVADDDACRQCGAALRACVNCRFFDPSARWECRAEIDRPARSKTAANRCPQWQPRLVSEHSKEKKSGPDAARAAFDDLFDF